MFRRSSACRFVIIEHLQTEPDFLCGVITGDETWIFVYDVETKRQNSLEVCEAEESKTVSQVDHILWCDVASLQRDPPVYALLIVWQDMRIVAGQIMAASPQQYAEYLVKWNVAVLGPPPYLSDLALCEIFLSRSSLRMFDFLQCFSWRSFRWNPNRKF